MDESENNQGKLHISAADKCKALKEKVEKLEQELEQERQQGSVVQHELKEAQRVKLQLEEAMEEEAKEEEAKEKAKEEKAKEEQEHLNSKIKKISEWTWVQWVELKVLCLGCCCISSRS